MKKHTLHRAVSALLVLTMVLTLCSTAFAASPNARVTVGMPQGSALVSKTDYTLTNGVTESQIIMNNTEGNSQVMGYMTTVAPGADATFKASYNGYYTEGSTAESRAELAKNLPYDMATTTRQAASYEAATGGNVIMAVNGDYYNMQNGQASGYLIMESNLVQKNREGCAEPYFAVLKDGSFAIRDYGEDCSDVAEAISGAFYLVKDGQVMGDLDAGLKAPRNSIGMKADGTVVVFLADGRHEPYSVGMTLQDIAEMMKAQDCVNVLYFDGGGSATFATKREGSDTLSIKNTPSDGTERVVASALLLVSTAAQSGKFDHASLEPNNELYIAGAPIQFTATGVDAGGYPADLPADAAWKLADDTFGTISKDGLFTSNGTCGTVTVNLISGGKVVGTTSVEVQEPDKLYFQSEALNLAFKSTTDLGLTASFNGRLMDLNGYVFDWKIESKTDGVAPADIGSFNGNQFTAVKAKQTLKADITVSYTKADSSKLTDTIGVEIGKMPSVLFDFEEDNQGNVPKVGDYDWGDGGRTWGDDSMTYSITGWDADAGAQASKSVTGPFAWDGWFIGDNGGPTLIPCSEILKNAGYSFYTWRNWRCKQSAMTGEVVSADKGETRFGDYALKLNYDFTDLQPGGYNFNQYLHYTGEDIDLEGAPNGLGVWIYAPEGTANFWLWATVSYYDEASDSYKEKQVHFTTQEGRNVQYNGIYWEGWMYCEANLSGLAQYVTPEHPLKLQSGHPLIMMTYIPGGSPDENGDKRPMGTSSAGTLYFDNFRVVYGDTLDDMEKPVVSGIQGNGTQIAADGSTVLTSNDVTWTASYNDPESDNASGINTAKTTIAIDGVKQTLTTAATETQASCSSKLSNGAHSITVSISDNFGNVSTDTRYVTVRSESTAYPAVSVSGTELATIGSTYTLQLKADQAQQLKDVQTKITLNDVFGQPQVAFDDAFNGESSYENGVLTISAVPKSATYGSNVATITFQVPAQSAKGTQLIYTAEGSATCDTTEYTFAQPKTSVGVSAPYELTADIMIAGATGKIYVTKTADGTPAAGIPVYAVAEPAAPTLVGKTNSEGVVLTNRFCQTADANFTIYAKDDSNQYSFRYTGTTRALTSEEALPTNIQLNAVADSATTQSMTWFSTPQYAMQNAVVQYTTKQAYDSGSYTFTTATGSSKATDFSSDNAVVLLNTVELSGLTAATEYVYRVGDGQDGHWSETATFTTTAENADTSFFVMGDAQLSGDVQQDAADIATIESIGAAVNKADVDFGIQTGDFVDNAGYYKNWNEILNVFNQNDTFLNIPTVQVLGNHEYAGNTSGALAQSIFNLPGKDYYSVEYGNVYVAVINCNAKLADAAKWLEEDAQKSQCTWKILTMHQPAYYTNPLGSSDSYNQYIPAAAQKAGIDFVFSGHDHAYARTQPMTDGAVDEENGVVYMICGDLGEKSRSSSYTAVDNPDFHFAKVTQKYDATYLLVDAAEKTFKVTAYNVDGTVIDSYEKDKSSDCDKNGHQYVYNRSDKSLTCSVCGEAAPADYTGFATDKATGKQMYFLNGQYKTGWLVLGTEIYHFGTNGMAHVVTVRENIPTNCTVQGHITVDCSCGETYTALYENPAGHSYVPAEDGEGYVCTVCGETSKINVPFVDVTDANWYGADVEYVTQNGFFVGQNPTTFGPNGKLNRAEFVTVLWRMAGKPESENTASCVFPDCSAGKWYTAAINWAKKTNIVGGYSDGTFQPKNNITREEMVTILHRYCKNAKLDVSDTASLSAFADANNVSKYATEAMQWAVAVGFIKGTTPTTLAPRANTSRAEIAAVIHRVAVKYQLTQNP